MKSLLWVGVVFLLGLLPITMALEHISPKRLDIPPSISETNAWVGDQNMASRFSAARIKYSLGNLRDAASDVQEIANLFYREISAVNDELIQAELFSTAENLSALSDATAAGDIVSHDELNISFSSAFHVLGRYHTHKAISLRKLGQQPAADRSIAEAIRALECGFFWLEHKEGALQGAQPYVTATFRQGVASHDFNTHLIRLKKSDRILRVKLRQKVASRHG
jgi:hypothetical protein